MNLRKTFLDWAKSRAGLFAPSFPSRCGLLWDEVPQKSFSSDFFQSSPVDAKVNAVTSGNPGQRPVPILGQAELTNGTMLIFTIRAVSLWPCADSMVVPLKECAMQSTVSENSTASSLGDLARVIGPPFPPT